DAIALGSRPGHLGIGSGHGSDRERLLLLAGIAGRDLGPVRPFQCGREGWLCGDGIAGRPRRILTMSLSVACPECGTPLEVDDEYRSWKVRCPRCRHEFLAESAAPAAELQRPSETDDDEVDRPRRRRKRRRP